MLNGYLGFLEGGSLLSPTPSSSMVGAGVSGFALFVACSDWFEENMGVPC